MLSHNEGSDWYKQQISTYLSLATNQPNNASLLKDAAISIFSAR